MGQTESVYTARLLGVDFFLFRKVVQGVTLCKEDAQPLLLTVFDHVSENEEYKILAADQFLPESVASYTVLSKLFHLLLLCY